MTSFKNILTIDMEEWYDRNDVSVPATFKDERHVEDQVLRLLDLLDRHEAKATFFILGYISEENPELVRKVNDRGHEVACHHLYHNLLYDYDPGTFREEIDIAKSRLEDVTGESVEGFRAPSWSINEENLWVLDVLKDEGFSYDSSIFPMKNYLYGVRRGRIFLHERDENFFEIPPTLYETAGGLRVPFSNGLFFRFWPEPALCRFIERINRKRRKPVVITLHPWEIFPDFERAKLPLHRSFIPYFNLRSCRKKLEKLLARYSFTSVTDILEIE